jgi:WD40 repeat protein
MLRFGTVLAASFFIGLSFSQADTPPLGAGLALGADLPTPPALGAGLPTPPPTAAARSADPRQVRILPGPEKDGSIRLPNQWSLRPAGRQIQLGDFPVNAVLHPTGKWLAVLHAGFGTHEIHIVSLKPQPRVLSRVTLPQTFCGLCFSPDGHRLFASGGEFDTVHVFHFADGYLSRPKQIHLGQRTDKLLPAGLAVDPEGCWLFAACPWGHAVTCVPLQQPKERVAILLEKGSYPYACLVDADRKRLYVSLWSKAAVAVIDLEAKKLETAFATDRHPTEMLLSPDGKALFVACSNSTRVSVLSADTGKGLETINCALYPNAPIGNTPSSLALTPDGQLLFVANADVNNVAIFNVSQPGKARPLGFIPVGMYPTAVRYNPADKRLYVANGRGTTPKANPHGPNPLLRQNQTVREYIAALYKGTLTILDLPSEERMLTYSKHAYLCSPLRADLGVAASPPKGSPIPGKIGEPSPIKHCLYIIRENRTYDQVFGDMKQGNGDPDLCIFPEKVTPNAHRLARQFVLLDNFYVDGEVSAEGHEWTNGAYCTDFVRKLWPLTYRGSPTGKFKKVYPSEGNFDEVERPAGGYLWDRCAEAGISYRSYGEWIEPGKTAKDPGKARVKALEGHFDLWFRAWDMDYPDVKRAERFIEELKRFERDGDLPRFMVMHLPNDHTQGTQVGKLTPTAHVAENDLALGMIVQAVTQSKFWKETVILVVEDDAQNGPDHVDAHRTVALVISPYSRRGYVDSSMYSTSSMVRTIELILGLRPMSQFDAAARPMYASFQAEPNLGPYEFVVPDVNMKAVNKKGDFGALLSAKLDLTRPDAADDLLLGEIVWRSVRGAHSPMPPPVRSAFVFPHLDDDD